MSTEHEFRYAVGQREVKGYDTQELRDAFLADKLMQEGRHDFDLDPMGPISCC